MWCVFEPMFQSPCHEHNYSQIWGWVGSAQSGWRGIGKVSWGRQCLQPKWDCSLPQLVRERCGSPLRSGRGRKSQECTQSKTSPPNGQGSWGSSHKSPAVLSQKTFLSSSLPFIHGLCSSLFLSPCLRMTYTQWFRSPWVKQKSSVEKNLHWKCLLGNDASFNLLISKQSYMFK